jgi:hypothetical protein
MKTQKNLSIWMSHSTANLIRFSKLLLTSLAAILSSNALAQPEEVSGETAIGFEVDAVPYLTCG